MSTLHTPTRPACSSRRSKIFNAKKQLNFFSFIWMELIVKIMIYFATEWWIWTILIGVWKWYKQSWLEFESGTNGPLMMTGPWVHHDIKVYYPMMEWGKHSWSAGRFHQSMSAVKLSSRIKYNKDRNSQRIFLHCYSEHNRIPFSRIMVPRSTPLWTCHKLHLVPLPSNILLPYVLTVTMSNNTSAQLLIIGCATLNFIKIHWTFELHEHS